MFKLDLDKAEEPEIKLPKSKRILEKHLLCFIDYVEALDCVDQNKLENS